MKKNSDSRQFSLNLILLPLLCFFIYFLFFTDYLERKGTSNKGKWIRPKRKKGQPLPPEQNSS
jgi:hypothetical protein